ncbi:MAG: LiaF domain-containing protein, partial [Actinomycetota bacterium]
DLAVGDLTVDLTALDPAAGTTEIEASVGIGQLVVEVPEGMDVRIEADASLGELEVLDRRESGFGNSVLVVDPGYETAAERVSLILSVGLGSLRVER